MKTATSVLVACASAIAVVHAQQQGHQKNNAHPGLALQECDESGCQTQQKSIVIDSNWMWLHNVGGYTNCYEGDTWSSSLCPDPDSCAANCALDAADEPGYKSTYGIQVNNGNALDLAYVTKEGNGQGANVGSRVYLLDSEDSYYMFKLKNREFSMDIDVSTMPCGVNAAVYFVEMDADGGMSKYPGNKAGAAYGTGYCDAQCPHDIKFINGAANLLSWDPVNGNSGTGKYGTCCTEVDILEANQVSQALTLHSCSVDGQTQCDGTECGDGADRYNGVCDKDGADFATFRLGARGFWGNSSDYTINTAEPVTVVTQFITDDGTDTGNLVEVRRLYVQNGQVIPTPTVNVGGGQFDSITEKFVSAEKPYFNDTNSFDKLGGMGAVSSAMDRGMVLAMSIWDDSAARMLWLDGQAYPTDGNPAQPGVARGTCADSTGDPASTEAAYPNAHVTYSNLKVGTLNSTLPSGARW